MAEREKFYCVKCGCELTDENCHSAHNDAGISAYCIDCEAASFENLASVNGFHFGLFLNCARFDIPCVPRIVPMDIAKQEGSIKDKWKWYVQAVSEDADYIDGKKTFEFDSAENNMLRVFGKELSYSDFARYILYEQQFAEQLPGTASQREKWGTSDLWKDVPMTKEIYDDLDRRFGIRIQSYSGQTVTPQMEETIVKACRFDAIMDKLLERGEARSAKEIQQVLDSMLASEQMRKKDEKPVEAFRFDAWIYALEKNGYMEKGDFVGKEKMINAMCNAMRRKKYAQPLDVAHQLEMNIINNARKNADQPQIYILPPEMELTDEYGEFEKEDTEEYKAALEYTKLAKVKVDKQQTKRKPVK